MNRPREPRLVIYSPDGLGHPRRTSLLATAFLRARPGASAPTISDSPLDQSIATMPRHDDLEPPSIRKTAPWDWCPVSLGSSFADVLRLSGDLVLGAVSTFSPHALLVDQAAAMGSVRSCDPRPRRSRPPWRVAT